VGIAIGIGAVLVLAVVSLLVMARQRSATGTLSRETRRRDEDASASVVPETAAPASADQPTADDESGAGRARADDARRAIEGGAGSALEPVGSKAPVVYEPVDLEELGVTRRAFFNRSILAGTGLGLGAFGVASLAFLWPSGAAGFGGKVTVGSQADIQAAFDNKIPFYNAGAKTYIVAYPKEDLPKAKKVPAYAQVISGMEEGYVALYQKCVHLGCRVPWCASSQWFECPCHGSKYNRVGEKQGGPAPRGLDRFPLEVSGGSVTVDTGIIVIGPPIGTNTTNQSPEGAPCV
jgi:cytochrome b6-f complex iron-sulfur subunit